MESLDSDFLAAIKRFFLSKWVWINWLGRRIPAISRFPVEGTGAFEEFDPPSDLDKRVLKFSVRVCWSFVMIHLLNYDSKVWLEVYDS